MMKDIPEDRLKEQWAALYADYRKTLSANRKSGKELEEYFLCKYEAEEYRRSICYGMQAQYQI